MLTSLRVQGASIKRAVMAGWSFKMCALDSAMRSFSSISLAMTCYCGLSEMTKASQER